MEYYGWIYCITNLINNKKYVGQTMSKYGYKIRWREHKKCLRNNNHKNNHLQNAWNKYGEKSFEFILLHEFICNTEKELKDMLDKIEIYYINKWDLLNRDMGYNIASGGSNGNPFASKTEDEMRKYGELRSKIAKNWWNNISDDKREQWIKKTSASRKGKNMGKDNQQSKMVAMINKRTNEIIKIFDSVADANEEICQDRSNRKIHMCATGNNKTAWGYKWRYLDEYGNVIFHENDEPILNKKIAMVDKNTNNIIKKFDNVIEANEYFNKNKENTNIYSCLRGKTKTAYGYIWKYIYE